MNEFELDISLCRQQIAELRKYTKDMSVLLVEDYLVLQKSLEKIFLAFFSSVDIASDGREGIKLYKDKMALNLRYDIVFSDIAMPNINGVELSKEIKNINPEQVILIFSAHQDSSYLLELINLGIKRFISKPILLRGLLDELIFTCKSIHEQQNLSNKISIGANVAYYKKEKDLYIDDKHIKLSNYEQLILELLITKMDVTVSNDEIVSYLYLNDIDVEFDNIRKIVYKLRKKLSNNIIQNIHGIGYRITTARDN